MSKELTHTTAVQFVVSVYVLTHVFTGITQWLTTFSTMKVAMVQGDLVKVVEGQALEGGQDSYAVLQNTDYYGHDQSIF